MSLFKSKRCSSGGNWRRRLALFLITSALSGAAAQPSPASPGTARMRERLAQYARQFGDTNPYANTALLKKIQAALLTVKNPAQRSQMQFTLAEELLNAGRPVDALAALSNVVELAEQPALRMGPRSRRLLDQLRGLASLRAAELQNCLQHHNADSCLLPIRGAGQYTERAYAQDAREIFLKLTRQWPRDLGLRWLLNVSAMTLGEYPDGLPADLRIPSSVFASDYPLPRFSEIAPAVGLNMNALAGGAITEDFDGDGLLDVFLTSWEADGQCRYFKNLGNGHFADRTVEAGLAGLTGGLNAMQTDYNNDGHPDIYIMRGAWLEEFGLVPNSLLEGHGDGTFEDVTEETGLLAFHPGLSAVWFDANQDGWLDLIVGNETAQPSRPHPCQLFLNDGHGKFRECAANAGLALQQFIRGISAGDFDNDGWPDLYISILGAPNRLLRNDGAKSASSPATPHFTDVTASAHVAEPLLSFPTWFWDYDNDGWLDVFVSGYGADLNAFSAGTLGHATLSQVIADKLGQASTAERPRLYRNTGHGAFQDVTREAGLYRSLLTMGANFGDLDNDGFLDFYLGTGAPYFGSLLPNEMFRNQDGKRFQNVTTAGGFGHLQKGHGIAFADLNNDGQQDVLLNAGGAFPGDNFFDALFANPGNTNHWLELKLVGVKSNRAAIGARLRVVASVGKQRREIHRVVGSGGSFGASPLRQEIGLGGASRIDRVEVWWPASHQTNVVTDLAPDHIYELTEGQTTARALHPKSFAWPNPTAAHRH